MTDSLTYADAGVDIDKANKLVAKFSKISRKTAISGVMGEIGGFGGLFSPNLANLDRPVAKGPDRKRRLTVPAHIRQRARMESRATMSTSWAPGPTEGPPT